jgi:hypothetical protein
VVSSTNNTVAWLGLAIISKYDPDMAAIGSNL